MFIMMAERSCQNNFLSVGFGLRREEEAILSTMIINGWVEKWTVIDQDFHLDLVWPEKANAAGEAIGLNSMRAEGRPIRIIVLSACLPDMRGSRRKKDNSNQLIHHEGQEWMKLHLGSSRPRETYSWERGGLVLHLGAFFILFLSVMTLSSLSSS